MKQMLALLLVVTLLVSGCGNGQNNAEESAASGAASEEMLEAPQGPPGLSLEDGEEVSGEESSQEEAPPEPPLEQPDITPQQAAELLSPGEDGGWVISTSEELCALAALVNAGEEGAAVAQVRLEADISLTGMDFIPIGSAEVPFSGQFDGNGHIISGLTVQGERDTVGLFGSLGSGGEVKNLHLTGGKVSGGNQVGGIAGSSSGKMTGCSYRGTVTATGQDVGGICGILKGDQTPAISGESTQVPKPSAQMADQATGGRLLQCAANVQLSGHARTGGLAGRAEGGTLIADSYALGSVTALKGEDIPHSIGGLIGEVSGYVTRCYVSIEVFTKVSSKVVGGLVGLIDGGAVSDSYLNSKPVENWKVVGYAAEEAPYEIKGCTVEEITEQSTFVGWNFSEVWDISAEKNRGLPFLRVIAGG